MGWGVSGRGAAGCRTGRRFHPCGRACVGNPRVQMGIPTNAVWGAVPQVGVAVPQLDAVVPQTVPQVAEGRPDRLELVPARIARTRTWSDPVSSPPHRARPANRRRAGCAGWATPFRNCATAGHRWRTLQLGCRARTESARRDTPSATSFSHIPWSQRFISGAPLRKHPPSQPGGLRLGG